jgi:hypothetical protein
MYILTTTNIKALDGVKPFERQRRMARILLVLLLGSSVYLYREVWEVGLVDVPVLRIQKAKIRKMILTISYADLMMQTTKAML